MKSKALATKENEGGRRRSTLRSSGVTRCPSGQEKLKCLRTDINLLVVVRRCLFFGRLSFDPDSKTLPRISKRFVFRPNRSANLHLLAIISQMFSIWGTAFIVFRRALIGRQTLISKSEPLWLWRALKLLFPWNGNWFLWASIFVRTSPSSSVLTCRIY